MRLREPFQKKHVHTWQPAAAPKIMQMDPMWGFEMEISDPNKVARKCVDCGCEQLADMRGYESTLDGLPKSVWHLADLLWCAKI